MEKINEIIKTKQPCIFRCDRAGVFFGELANYDGTTLTAEIRNARRLWYWDGAASLSQLALEGVKAPKNCKFTVTVDNIVLTGICEILPCTPAAIESINSVAVWKR